MPVDFKISPEVELPDSPLSQPQFAIGATGALYLVTGERYDTDALIGICIVAKKGSVAVGKDTSINEDRILPPGTVITITIDEDKP